MGFKSMNLPSAVPTVKLITKNKKGKKTIVGRTKKMKGGK